MKISGFTMVRNGDKLYYPVKESVQSILPVVNEFIVALGKGDADDQTENIIRSIDSDKIKIIHTEWDLEKYPRGMENAHQTDIAKSHCKGDWLFYLQADEVVHEKDLPVIQKRCEQLLHHTKVEGLLFNYYHFWGDYEHYQYSHGWYPKEIRIVRNDKDIHSWESAQSFRRIPDFDGISYRQQEGTHKLKVAAVDAHIYHYGYVRPPDFMQRKKHALDTIHHGSEKATAMSERTNYFDYGPLGNVAKFTGTHPAVMQSRNAQFDWAAQLNYSAHDNNPARKKHKHEKLKNRMLTFFENNFLAGKRLFQFENYELLKGV
jgi:hypothetical protein